MWRCRDQQNAPYHSIHIYGLFATNRFFALVYTSTPSYHQKYGVYAQH